MTSTGMYNLRKIHIVKLVWYPMRGYHAQYRRSLVTELQGDSLNEIVNSSTGYSSFGSNFFGRHGSSIIKLDTNVEQNAPVDITNGWNRERLRFVMEVQTEDNMGTQRTFQVSGWSENDQFRSHGGGYDMNQVFFINNIDEIQLGYRNIPGVGKSSYARVVESSQIVSNPNYSGIFSSNQNYSLKPDLILKRMGYMDAQRVSDGGYLYDACAVVGTVAGKINRLYTLPSVYASKIVDGYVKATQNDGGDTFSDITQDLSIQLESGNIGQDVFMAALRSVQARRSYGPILSNTFTLADLVGIDPTLQNAMRERIITPLDLMSKLSYNSPDPRSAATWGGSDLFDRCAATLASTIPGIISQFGFTTYSFSAHNHTTNGEIIVQTLNYNSYNQRANLQQQIEAMESRIAEEILFGLSDRSRVSFEMSMNCDRNSDTFIDLRLEGESRPYVFPQFCDGLMSSLVTSQEKRLDGVCRDMSQLMTSIADNSNNRRYGGLIEPSGKAMTGGGFNNNAPASEGSGYASRSFGNKPVV